MWRRRVGSLRGRRTCTALSTVTAICARLCASAALCAAASDERALRQALTIVQLLRAEYRPPILRMTETPAPTCATTAAPLFTRIDPSRRQWTMQYGTSGPQRRFDYDNDAFGAHPSPSSDSSQQATNSPNTVNQDPTVPQPNDNQPSSLTTTTPALLITVSSRPSSLSTLVSTPTRPRLKQTSIPSSNNQSSLISSNAYSATFTEFAPKTIPTKISHFSPKPTSDFSLNRSLIYFTTSQTSAAKNQVSTTAMSTLITQKLGWWMKKSSVTVPPMPDLEQVAMELANELSPDWPVKLKKPASTKRPRARASWREYLARSTRYPLPLPENHAFCHTDPQNALCRTFI